MAPFRARVPLPSFVRLRLLPASPIPPPTVRVLARTATVRSPDSETAPVPRFNDWVPTNWRLPDQVWALLVESARLATELSRLPPARVSGPDPRAAALPSESVPAESVTPPSKVLAPARPRKP